MKRKMICMMLALCLTISCTVLVTAADAEHSNAATITISFGNVLPMAITEENIANGFESSDVRAFFESNEMNYNYYRDWLYDQDMEGLESITITVLPSNDTENLASVNSVVYDSRMVYVDRNYHYDPKTNQLTVGALMKNAVSELITLTIGKYSQIVASLASILGITHPDTYFGTDRVRQGKEYYVNDGANRVVTKFVELYAPVSGVTKWYAWGYAEGDYVRHGVQLYYKGLEEGAKNNIYHQYYTENYYRESVLIDLVKDAYSRGSDYCEVADDYAAEIGGYDLYDRDITVTKYLEYDDLCN